MISLATRFRSRAIDRELIGGGDPAQSDELAARAAQLTSDRTRMRLADDLDRVVSAAHEARGRARVAPSGGAIDANATELAGLAELLRSSAPVYARGVAMLAQLLADGTGPVYTDPEGDELGERLRAAWLASRHG